MSLSLKTCLQSERCFFKHFNITQGDFSFYSGVEILEIKTIQWQVDA